MSGPQFMPFYIGDYLRDTQHLTTEQHGAYLLLLFACWSMAKLPDDDGKLMAITCCENLEKWRNIRKTLEPFFDSKRGFWVQKRIKKERKIAQKIANVRSAAGQKGAASRWQHKVKTKNASANGKTMARARVPQPQPYKKTTRLPRLRAREAPAGRGKKQENGALADIEAKPPRFARIERSSKPAVRQPSNAKSRLMQKVARWLPEDAVAGFWAAMMAPDAQQTLDRAVEQMRASGWEDRG